MPKRSLSKEEVSLLLNIVETESIKLDSIKSKKEYKRLEEPRRLLDSLKKKLPLIFDHAYNVR